jgi:hypothetical protein
LFYLTFVLFIADAEILVLVTTLLHETNSTLIPPFAFFFALFCLSACSKTGPDDPNNPASQTPASAKDQKYQLEIRITEFFGSFVYSDSVSMIVLVTKDNKVTVSDIRNFHPKTNTPTYSLGSCTATWIQDTIGEVNITGVQGTIDGLYGDSSRALFLNLTDSGAVSPGFIKVCGSSTPETDPAIPVTGIPGFSYFTLSPGQKIYEADTGDEYDRLTLLQ